MPLDGSVDLNVMNLTESKSQPYQFCDVTKRIYKNAPPLLLLTSDDIRFYGQIKNYLRHKNVLNSLESIMKILSDKFNLNTDIFIFPIAPSVPEFLNTPIQSLSGGQLQRLLIFTALLQMPNIILLDESTSNLDEIADKLIMTELCKYANNRPNSAIIFTSHSSITRLFATKTISFKMKVLIVNDGTSTSNWGLQASTRALSTIFNDLNYEIDTISHSDLHKVYQFEFNLYGKPFFNQQSRVLQKLSPFHLKIPQTADEFCLFLNLWAKGLGGSFSEVITNKICESDIVVFNAEGSTYRKNHGALAGLLFYT